MVDEFQDTNRLQLDVLEALERDNLFAVGDEFQSIYGFRHADVTIFRERRAALGEERVRLLTANFRSREELLDVLNAAYAPQWPERFAPLLAGNGTAHDDGGELRLFDPGDPGGAVPERRAARHRLARAGTTTPGSGSPASRPSRTGGPRRARSPTACARRSTRGRPARDIVVLVRATASLRVLEEALEEQGVTTYVVGGRGYWSQQPVRDGIAYLAALANPLDEESLLGVLASPFCGVGSDALILLADAGRASGGGVWAALRAGDAAPRASRRSDARAAAGVRDVLRRRAGARGAAARRGAARAGARGDRLRPRGARAGGGERRLANLRKLMRLAREYERAEGRDLHGFLAYAATRDFAAAREGEAPLESEGLDAVRLMTIHRAKGLEFPVVCVADLGRQGAGQRDRLLIGPDGASRAAPAHARRRRDGARARLRAARRRGRDRGGRGGAAAVLRRDDARPRPPDPVRQHRTPSARPRRAPAARRSTGSRPRCSAARSIRRGPSAS